MGLYGMVVVTCAPTVTAGCPVTTTTTLAAGTAYPAGANPTLNPAVTYAAEANLLFSEIDPVQNNAVNAAVNTAGFSETKVWSGQPGGCGNPSSGALYQTCYPPAVNYSPRYSLHEPVDDHRIADAGTVAQRRFDLAKLDAMASQLDLVVDPSEEVQLPTGMPAGEVTRAIEPLA